MPSTDFIVVPVTAGQKGDHLDTKLGAHLVCECRSRDRRYCAVAGPPDGSPSSALAARLGCRPIPSSEPPPDGIPLPFTHAIASLPRAAQGKRAPQPRTATRSPLAGEHGEHGEDATWPAASTVARCSWEGFAMTPGTGDSPLLSSHFTSGALPTSRRPLSGSRPWGFSSRPASSLFARLPDASCVPPDGSSVRRS